MTLRGWQGVKHQVSIHLSFSCFSAIQSSLFTPPKKIGWPFLKNIFFIRHVSFGPNCCCPYSSWKEKVLIRSDCPRKLWHDLKVGRCQTVSVTKTNSVVTLEPSSLVESSGVVFRASCSRVPCRLSEPWQPPSRREPLFSMLRAHSHNSLPLLFVWCFRGDWLCICMYK